MFLMVLADTFISFSGGWLPGTNSDGLVLICLLEAWSAITKELVVSNDLRKPGPMSPEAMEMFSLHSCHKWKQKVLKFVLNFLVFLFSSIVTIFNFNF